MSSYPLHEFVNAILVPTIAALKTIYAKKRAGARYRTLEKQFPPGLTGRV
jgi:hypothetical protein